MRWLLFIPVLFFPVVGLMQEDFGMSFIEATPWALGAGAIAAAGSLLKSESDEKRDEQDEAAQAHEPVRTFIIGSPLVSPGGRVFLACVGSLAFGFTGLVALTLPSELDDLSRLAVGMMCIATAGFLPWQQAQASKRRGVRVEVHRQSEAVRWLNQRGEWTQTTAASLSSVNYFRRQSQFRFDDPEQGRLVLAMPANRSAQALKVHLLGLNSDAKASHSLLWQNSPI